MVVEYLRLPVFQPCVFHLFKSQLSSMSSILTDLVNTTDIKQSLMTMATTSKLEISEC